MKRYVMVLIRSTQWGSSNEYPQYVPVEKYEKYQDFLVEKVHYLEYEFL